MLLTLNTTQCPFAEAYGVEDSVQSKGRVNDKKHHWPSHKKRQNHFYPEDAAMLIFVIILSPNPYKTKVNRIGGGKNPTLTVRGF